MTPLIDWSLALVPVLVMMALFVWLDMFKLMSVGEMVVRLLLGAAAALAAWPLSGSVLDQLPMGFSFYSRFVAPWIEEALKGLMVLGLFAFNRIGYKLDAVISGFAIGAGFSVVENIFYLLRYPELESGVWLVRGLGTAVMHGTTTAILAAIAHELGERLARKPGGRFAFNPLHLIPGYIVASLIHLVFNQFPDEPMTVMIVTAVAAPLLLMAVLSFGEKEARAWLAEDSAGHQQRLATLRAGGFPDDASGQHIAALAVRVGPGEAARIRDYCIARTELVLIAEEELGERDRKLDAAERERIHALIERIGALEHEIGRSGMAALRPLLPFTRNDAWEVKELRELLRKR
jgi:RsiW-degrading membrane proteinase PrsW (M82 family)